ncbi:response regulator, partial [Longispora fulva]|uniref:response regulator n=2 Tax=Bacteria TaxID=2 RepID=UPI003635128C
LHKVLVKKTMDIHNVMEFKNAPEALNYVRKHNSKTTPLLILLDINMPKMSGWDFLDLLQKEELEAEPLVVMVTSSINSSDRERAGTYPMVIDYLEKPLNKADCNSLNQKISSFL